MKQAVGLLEVQGYSVALAAMDQACKSAEIIIEGIDCNNPLMGDAAPIPVVIQVKFTGSVSNVKIALEAARIEAMKYIAEHDIVTHLIPAALADLQKLLPIGKVNIK